MALTSLNCITLDGFDSYALNPVILNYRDLTEGKPLPLVVSGIEYMNDDPSMVDVLYAKVQVKGGSDA